MHQSTLDGIPQAQAVTARRAGGRPPLPAEKKPIGRFDVGYYREDEEAIEILREAGYGTSASAILRKLARERAAQIKAAGPEAKGRLAL